MPGNRVELAVYRMIIVLTIFFYLECLHFVFKLTTGIVAYKLSVLFLLGLLNT